MRRKLENTCRHLSDLRFPKYFYKKPKTESSMRRKLENTWRHFRDLRFPKIFSKNFHKVFKLPYFDILRKTQKVLCAPKLENTWRHFRDLRFLKYIFFSPQIF